MPKKNIPRLNKWIGNFKGDDQGPLLHPGEGNNTKGQLPHNVIQNINSIMKDFPTKDLTFLRILIF